MRLKEIILTSRTILTNGMQNHGLFYNFAALRNYYDYSLFIQ